MKAMILAAGLGERMRPLTEKTPKPLLPLAGKPLIVHALLHCKAAGITDVVINVFHLAEQFYATLGDGSDWGVHIHYSREDAPLGMAGGVIHALPLLGNEPFVLMSGDIYATYDLSGLVAKGLQVSHGHLVLRRRPPYEFYHLAPNGTVSLHGDFRLDYAGIGVFHPTIFRDFPEGHRTFKEVMDPWVGAGVITGERFEGEWHNLTTIAEYEALCNNMAPS